MTPDAQAEEQHDKKGRKISMERMMFNLKQIDTVGAVIYMTGGTIAGILGLTGIHGLYLFLVVLFISKITVLAKMGFNLRYNSSSFCFSDSLITPLLVS